MTYVGGNKVGKGTYWNLSNGQRIDVDDEGVLPGDERSRFVKASSGLMLLLGPVLGLGYVILLPFMAIATVLGAAGAKLLSGITGLVGNVVSFGWRPSEAHLAGKKAKKKEEGKKDSKKTK